MFLNALSFVGNLWWWSFRIVSVAWRLHVVVYIITKEMDIYFCRARSHCDRGLIWQCWRWKQGSDKNETYSPSLLDFSVCKLSTTLSYSATPPSSKTLDLWEYWLSNSAHYPSREQNRQEMWSIHCQIMSWFTFQNGATSSCKTCSAYKVGDWSGSKTLLSTLGLPYFSKSSGFEKCNNINS